MLTQQAATCKKWAATRPGVASVRRMRHTPAHKPATVVKADNVEFQLPAEGGDLSPGIAAGYFVAAKQGLVQASVENMKYVLCIGILLHVAANVLMRRDVHHWDVDALAPATLALNSLGYLSLGTAGIACFGTLLCTAMEGALNVKNSYWVLLISLAAAVYYEVGAIWICAAAAICYVRQFVRQVRDNKFSVSTCAVSVVSLFALFRYATEKSMSCATEVAISFVIARCGWSAFKIMRSVFQTEFQDD